MQTMLRAEAFGAPIGAVWGDAEARFYVEGLERSDYVQRMGVILAGSIEGTESLLDIGAGAGTLPRAFLHRDAAWTALEPNGYLVNRLRLLRMKEGFRLKIVQDVWQRLGRHGLPMHDTVLAANTSGPVEDPRAFWWTLAAYARRRMVWTVPAQRGPRNACLSGALPPELHGEDETPAVELILARLPKSLQPQDIRFAEWTFRYAFPDFAAADAWFQGRFNPDRESGKRRALRAHLEHTLIEVGDGVQASAKKRGACLIWNF